MPAVSTVVSCPRDPGVETALRCSRCETPICPKCLVQSPVGARCKDCAKVMRSPIYTLSGDRFLKGAGAALVGGIVMGLIWGFVLLPFSFGYLSILLGALLGWVFTRLMDLATGKRRGPLVVTLASAGIVLAWGIQAVILGNLQLAAYGLVAVGVGVYFAYYSLSRV